MYSCNSVLFLYVLFCFLALFALLLLHGVRKLRSRRCRFQTVPYVGLYLLDLEHKSVKHVGGSEYIRRCVFLSGCQQACAKLWWPPM